MKILKIDSRKIADSHHHQLFSNGGNLAEERQTCIVHMCQGQNQTSSKQNKDQNYIIR